MSKTARDVIAEFTFEMPGKNHTASIEFNKPHADKLIAALAVAGFVIVPKEPPDEALVACMWEPYTGPPKRILAEMYRVMIAAATDEAAK